MPLIDEDMALRIEEAKRQARLFLPEARERARWEEAQRMGEERMRELQMRELLEEQRAALGRMDARPPVVLPEEGPVIDAWRRQNFPDMPQGGPLPRADIASSPAWGAPPRPPSTGWGSEAERAEMLRRLEESLSTAGPRQEIGSVPQYLGGAVMAQRQGLGSLGSMPRLDPAEIAAMGARSIPSPPVYPGGRGLYDPPYSSALSSPMLGLRQDIQSVPQYLGGAQQRGEGGGTVELYPPSEGAGLYPTLPITPPIR